MELVYQTSDMDRAQEIIGVLNEAGIETTLQGVNYSNLHFPPFNSLTVWVMDDTKVSRALGVLEGFYASESPTHPLPPAANTPRSSTNKLFWFLVMLVSVIALGLIA